MIENVLVGKIDICYHNSYNSFRPLYIILKILRFSAGKLTLIYSCPWEFSYNKAN